jgi:four helix bundle protein
LIVWQKAMQFVTNVYTKSALFPQNEQFGLISQIRRSAVSIPSNIAEGYGRNSTGDYTRFLQIALGSLFEIQTQIEIAFNLNYISENDFQTLFDLSREIERMLSSLIYKLKNDTL